MMFLWTRRSVSWRWSSLFWYTITTPTMKPTLAWWGNFQIKRFQQSALKRRAQLSVAVTIVRLNRYSLLLCQDLSQYWKTRLGRPSLVKSDLSWCSVGSTILLFCWVRIAPEVSEEEGSYVLRFYRWVFRRLIRVAFCFSWLCSV